MKEMTIQGIVKNVINSLIRSGEFRDNIDIVKLLLLMLHLYDRHTSEFNMLLQEHRFEDFWKIYDINEEINFPNVKLPYEHSAVRLLCEALIQLLPAYRASSKEVVDTLILSTSSWSLGRRGLDTEPEDIARLVAFIAKRIGIDDAYDPFSGLASFATAPEFEGISFKGAEFNPDAADIANLRLALNGQPMTVERFDSFAQWNYTSFCEGFVSNPPYGVRLNNYDRELNTNANRSEDFIVEQIIERDDVTKAVVVLPLHRFAESYELINSRKHFVKTGKLEMVISLPSASLFGTDIPTVIVVINKDLSEEESDYVTFISLSDCVHKDGNKIIRLNLDEAKARIMRKDGKLAKRVHWTEILKDDFCVLNPGKFLLDDVIPNQYEGRNHYSPLLSLVKPDTKTITLGQKRNVVGIKDLEDEYSFSKEGVCANTEISSRYYEINEPSILVGLYSSRLKVGMIYPKDNPISVSADIVAIKPDDFWINPEYLMLELTKPYVQDQIRLLGYDRRFGKTETILREIKVVNPPIDDQRKIVEDAKNRILTKFQHVMSAAQTDFRKDIHMKRHAIGQTIATIGSWWTLLENARMQGGLIDEAANINNLDLTLGEVLDNLRTGFARISNQVDKFDRGYNAKSTSIDLMGFIKSYMETHKTPIFHYSPMICNGDYVDVESESDEKCLIQFPREALTMILNNIISNACSHGFGNISSNDNIVRITIENMGGSCIVSVANNGKPVPDDMTPEKMITYGESSDLKHHCGIGGYETHQLIRDFGGSLEIKLNASANFPVEYCLTFKSSENE